MKMHRLLLLLMLGALPAQAVTFECQNRAGKASVEDVAVVREEEFLGEIKTVVHIPSVVEGRDFVYAEAVLGSPEQDHAVVQAQTYRRTYGNKRDWLAIDVKKRGTTVPLALNVYYGANAQCQTKVHVEL